MSGHPDLFSQYLQVRCQLVLIYLADCQLEKQNKKVACCKCVPVLDYSFQILADELKSVVKLGLLVGQFDDYL